MTRVATLSVRILIWGHCPLPLADGVTVQWVAMSGLLLRGSLRRSLRHGVVRSAGGDIKPRGQNILNIHDVPPPENSRNRRQPVPGFFRDLYVCTYLLMNAFAVSLGIVRLPFQYGDGGFSGTLWGHGILGMTVANRKHGDWPAGPLAVGGGGGVPAIVNRPMQDRHLVLLSISLCYSEYGEWQGEGTQRGVRKGFWLPMTAW